MGTSSLEKRITKLERATRDDRSRTDSRGFAERVENRKTSWLQQLQALTEEAKLIGGRAESAGDYRVALGCIHELCRIVELMAKLQGDLDDRSQINILNVGVDLETAKRMAETFLSRHKVEESK
jgi:hypothetical protein